MSPEVKSYERKTPTGAYANIEVCGKYAIINAYDNSKNLQFILRAKFYKDGVKPIEFAYEEKDVLALAEANRALRALGKNCPSWAKGPIITGLRTLETTLHNEADVSKDSIRKFN